MQLEGRIALVTGAARRLGRAIALTLAEAGADVILHVHTSSAQELAAAIRRRGRRALILEADLRRVADVQGLSERALEFDGRVDVLVNNAALFYPTPIARLSAAEWRTFLHTNLTAAFCLGLHLGRAMRRQGAGKIIQLGDWSGLRPSPDYLAYCVSKGGIQALSVALAKALAPQVQVNTIAPGPVLPPAAYTAGELERLRRNTPLGRLGSPHDVARTVRFLIERGDFISGATYVLDGGWLACGPGGKDTVL
jgi:NAD(P)-dependent dehydrogenase (short-subunit alcohol dehydrogenase family)